MKFSVLKGAAFGILCIPAVGGITAYALPGWDNVSGEWKYYDKDNNAVTDSWRMSNGTWRYLSDDGTILKNSMLSYRGDLYYLKDNGEMAANEWHLDNIDNQFPDGWYYFESDGKAYKKHNNQFKKEINGKEYIFNEDGVMLTGWIDKEGNPMDKEESDPFIEGSYLAGPDGALKTAEWYLYGNDSTPFSISNAFSATVDRDYSDYKEMWFYFDEKSKKVSSKEDGKKLKEKTINGVTYGFDENGVMNPWWSAVASVSDLKRANPTSDESAKYYSGYDGGGLLKNKWFWMYPSENLDETDYLDRESSWWRSDNRGKVIRNKIKEINGRDYAFDGIGRMKTGFVLFDGRNEFVAQYDVDMWDSDAFINGDIYGIERSDLYLFSPDEQNDGSMQTGGNIQVDLDDGIFTFGFRKNGKAYGNRNKLEEVDNKYYINGLRLQADQEWKYGLVRVDKEGKTFYKAVGSNGNIVKGKKKVLKCGDNAYLLLYDNNVVGYIEDQEKAPKWLEHGDAGAGFYQYNGDNKDHYAGGFIVGEDGIELDGLPSEMNLNFK
jgi:glucan-binding YG repeat protein